MLPKFASVIPDSKEKALAYLSSLADTRVIAGGTDLIIKFRRGETCSHVLDISRISELKGISELNGRLIVGAVSTHQEISANPLVRMAAPSLSVACGWVGSPAIRNMGTLGGNLVNASPAADSLAPLLIHDATVLLESQNGVRRMDVADFIVAPYRTGIDSRELLTGVEMSRLTGYREGYRRVAKRAAWAISRLSIAWAIDEENGVFRDIRLAIGSCTPMPFRPRAVEASLVGRQKTEETIATAIDGVLDEIRRISGVRPSFVYKLPVVRDLLGEILRG